MPHDVSFMEKLEHHITGVHWAWPNRGYAWPSEALIGHSPSEDPLPPSTPRYHQPVRHYHHPTSSKTRVPIRPMFTPFQTTYFPSPNKTN